MECETFGEIPDLEPLSDHCPGYVMSTNRMYFSFSVILLRNMMYGSSKRQNETHMKCLPSVRKVCVLEVNGRKKRGHWVMEGWLMQGGQKVEYL